MAQRIDIWISDISTTGFRVNGKIQFDSKTWNALGFNVYTEANGFSRRNHTAVIPNRGGSYSFSDYYSVSASTSDRTITCRVGADLSWSATGSSTGNPVSANANIPAVKPQIQYYSISYNSLNGVGTPSAQTKEQNKNITLSSAIPTKSAHTFQGWSTTPGGSVTYRPGATYSANASIVLYAVWVPKYQIKMNLPSNAKNIYVNIPSKTEDIWINV